MPHKRALELATEEQEAVRTLLRWFGDVPGFDYEKASEPPKRSRMARGEGVLEYRDPYMGKGPGGDERALL